MKKLTSREARKILEDDICELYKEGYTIDDIIGKVNLTFNAVREILIKNNLKKLKKPLIKIDRKKLEEIIIIESDKGKAINEIAFDLNIDINILASLLKKNNRLNKIEYGGKIFKTRHELSYYRTELAKKIQMDFKNGMEGKEIAKKYKISTISVGKYLKNKI